MKTSRDVSKEGQRSPPSIGPKTGRQEYHCSRHSSSADKRRLLFEFSFLKNSMDKAPPYRPEESITFLWNSKKKKFVSCCYTEKRTQYRVNKTHRNDVMAALKKSKYYYPPSQSTRCIIIITISMVFLFGGLGYFFFYTFTPKDEQSSLLAPTFGLPLGFIGAFLTMFILPYFFKRYTKKQLEKREIDFKQILENLNETQFRKRGVQWNLGEYGAWICLVLDYKKQLDNTRRRSRLPSQISFRKVGIQKKRLLSSIKDKSSKIIKAKVKGNIVKDSKSLLRKKKKSRHISKI